MFANIFGIALTLSVLTTVLGFYEVSVTEGETAERECFPRGYVDKTVDCISPLIQLLMLPRHTYAQTANQEEALTLVLGQGYLYRGTLGRVVTKKEGCECSDGTELVPVHILIKNGQYDYTLSSNPAEIETLKNSGYTDKRIDFYCSPEKNKCGATLPLYRHKSQASLPFATSYTTNDNQNKAWDAASWKSDGIVCYIWQKQFNAHNYSGQN